MENIWGKTNIGGSNENNNSSVFGSLTNNTTTTNPLSSVFGSNTTSAFGNVTLGSIDSSSNNNNNNNNSNTSAFTISSLNPSAPSFIPATTNRGGFFAPQQQKQLQQNVLFVSNIPFGSTGGNEALITTEIRNHFSKFGSVESISGLKKTSSNTFSLKLVYSKNEEASEALKLGKKYNNSILIIKLHKYPNTSNPQQPTNTTTTITSPSPFTQKSNNYNDLSTILKKDDELMLKSQERNLRFQLMKSSAISPTHQSTIPTPTFPSRNQQQDIDDNDGEDEGEEGEFEEQEELPEEEEEEGLEEGEEEEEFEISSSPPLIASTTTTTTTTTTNSTTIINNSGLDHKIGLCFDFIPKKEKTHRESSGDINILERSPLNYEQVKLIKKYKRNVADDLTEIPPEEIRPVHILLEVMNYITSEIVDQEQLQRPGVSFAEIQNFVRDRTRSLRQDLTSQHSKDGISIDIHERCTRFHIVSHHYLCEYPDKDFNAFQNREQLNNCLTSLKQFYNDHFKNTNSLIAKNEPEFRSYYILNNLENNVDLVSYMIDIPRVIFHHPFIQYAIEVWKAYRSDNYCRFFMLTLAGTYLQQCLLHRYFTNVRKIAVKRIARSYRAPNASTTLFPVSDFNSILMFSDNSETIHFLDGIAGITLENDQIVVTKNGFSVKSIDEINITPKKSPIIMSKAPSGSNSFQLTIDKPEPVPVAKYRKCFIDFDQSYLPSPQIYSNLSLVQESQQSYVVSHQAASGPMKDLTTKNAMAFTVSNKVTKITATTPSVPLPSVAKPTTFKLTPSNIIGSNKTPTTTPITTPTTTPIKANIPPTTPTSSTSSSSSSSSSLFTNKISNFGVGINNAINPSVVTSPSIFGKPTTTEATTTANTTTAATTIAPTTTTTTKSIFGTVQQPPSTPTFTDAKSIFGQQTTPSSISSPTITTTTKPSDIKSIFGTTSTPPTSSIFGTASTETPSSIFSPPTLQQPTTISKPPAATTTTLTSSSLFQPTPQPTTPTTTATTKPDIPNSTSIFGSGSLKDVTPTNAFTTPAVPKTSSPQPIFNTPTTHQSSSSLKSDNIFGGSAFTTPQRTNKQQDIALTPMSVLVNSKSKSATATSEPLFLTNNDYQNSPMPISTIKPPKQQLPPSHLQSISSPMTLSTPYVNLNNSQTLKQKPTIPFPVDQIVNEQKQQAQAAQQPQQHQQQQQQQQQPIVVKKPKEIKKSYEEKSNDALLSYMFRSWKFQVLHFKNQQKQLQNIGNKVTGFDNMNSNYFGQPQPQQLIVQKKLSQQNTIAPTTTIPQTIPQRQLNSNIKIDLLPINIPYYIYQHLDKINKMNQKNQPLVWKLIYSSPPPTQNSDNNLKQFVDVISHKLSFERNVKNIKDEDTLCLVQKYHIEYQNGGNGSDDSQTADRSIGVVVKRVTNSQQFLSNQRGSSSILLQISKSIGFDENCKSQLVTIMKSTQIEDPIQRIPIVFLVVNDCLVNQSDEEDSLVYENIENSIGSFINSNSTLWNQVIVSYKVLIVDEIESIVNSDSNNNILVYLIKWLSSNSPPIPFTEIRPLTSVLDSVILSKFSTIFKSFYCQLQSPKLYYQQQLQSQSLSTPQSIVNYFNNTINQLIQFLTNPALKSIQWPVPEFSTSTSSNWNSDSTFNSIKSSLKSILLNDLPNDLKNLIGTTSKLVNGNNSGNNSGGINEHYESIEPIIKSCFQWVSSHQKDKIDIINIENQIKDIFIHHFNCKFDKYNNGNSQYFIVIPWDLIFESVFSYQICKIPFVSSFFSDELISDLPNFENQDNQQLKVVSLPVKQQPISSSITLLSPLKRKQQSDNHFGNEFNNHKYHKVHFDEMELEELKSNDINPIKRKQQIVNNNIDNGDNSLYSISGIGSNGLNSSSLILDSQIQLNKSLIEKNQNTSKVLDQLLSSIKNEKRIERSTTKLLVSTYNNNLKNQQQQLTTSNYNNSLTTSSIVFKNQRLTGSVADISEQLLSIIENENEI